MDQISLDKYKVINLKTDYSEFLGFKLKVWKKRNKWVVKSHVSDKALTKCKKEIKDRIKDIGKVQSYENAFRYNATVLGMHQYYKVATNVYLDFDKIAFSLDKSLKCRTHGKRNFNGIKSKAFMKYYGKYKGRVIYINKIALYPISLIDTKPPIWYEETKVLIPISLLNVRVQNKRIIRGMIGAEIDFIVLEYDEQSNIAIASRKLAMEIRQEIEIPKLKVNDVVRVRIVTVARKYVVVDFYGREIQIFAHNLKHTFIVNCKDKYHVGDYLIVRIKN